MSTPDEQPDRTPVAIRRIDGKHGGGRRAVPARAIDRQGLATARVEQRGVPVRRVVVQVPGQDEGQFRADVPRLVVGNAGSCEVPGQAHQQRAEERDDAEAEGLPPGGRGPLWRLRREAHAGRPYTRGRVQRSIRGTVRFISRTANATPSG